MAVRVHYDDGAALVHGVVVGPLENNAYVVGCARTGATLIVDAADEADEILAAVSERPLTAILTTHAHADHIAAAAEVSAATAAPIRIHAADALAAGFDRWEPIEDDEEIRVGDLTLRAIHTPGHTPGSLCFRLDRLLFSGDTLFPGGPGATTGAETFAEIMESLETRLFTLPDETIVLPGHGPATTIGAERPALPEWRKRGY